VAAQQVARLDVQPREITVAVLDRFEVFAIAEDRTGNILFPTFQWVVADPAIAEVLRAYLARASDTLPDTETTTIAPFGWDTAKECFRTLQAGETWRTYGAWIEANRPALGPGIKERYAWASTVGADDMARAASVRESIVANLRSLIKPGTLVCLPTAASLPARLDASDDELEAFRAGTVALVCLAGLSGLPQISIPAATLDGVPVGLSFLGWAGSDEALLDLAVTLAAFRARPVDR